MTKELEELRKDIIELENFVEEHHLIVANEFEKYMAKIKKLKEQLDELFENRKQFVSLENR